MNRQFSWIKPLFTLLSITTFALTAHAQAPAAEQYYVPIDPPIATENTAKIEVIEFFSYACPHCNDLNPLISKWAEKLPTDVSFKRVAIPGRAFYSLMAKAFYTLEIMGETKRLDNLIFAAIHKSKTPDFDSESSMIKWMVSQGVDEKKFTETFKSFGVDNKMRQADQLARAAKVESVPSIIVDGRYHVVKATNFADLLAKADKLIALRRAERKK